MKLKLSYFCGLRFYNFYGFLRCRLGAMFRCIGFIVDQCYARYATRFETEMPFYIFAKKNQISLCFSQKFLIIVLKNFARLCATILSRKTLKWTYFQILYFLVNICNHYIVTMNSLASRCRRIRIQQIGQKVL